MNYFRRKFWKMFLREMKDRENELGIRFARMKLYKYRKK